MICKPLRTLSPKLAYLAAIAACGLIAFAAMPLRHTLDLANIAMLFLFVVFMVAVKLGRGPAVVAALLSVLLFDYVFVPPHLALIPVDPQHVVILAVMLAVALVTARLTAGLQEQAELACSRERQAQRLYQLARDLAGAVSRWEVQGALDAFLGNTGYRAVLHFMDEGGGVPDPVPGEALGHVVQEAIRRGEPVEGEFFGPALCLPLRAPGRTSGVMVVTVSGEGADPRREKNLFAVVASLIAIAIERLHYVEVAQETQVQAESERLRSSLLSALSHDLRTPLTALVGLADSLALAMAKDNPDDPTSETAAAICLQAREMNNLLANLLDMARLQAGKVALRKEWQLFDDVIGSSVRLLKMSQSTHPVRVRLETELPLVEFDAVLMERVIWNLAENAFKYSPEGTPIEIGAYTDKQWACLTVCDRGPGFPPCKAEEVFEMFVRGTPESSKSGVGLGLAICRAIVNAHGGTIHAENRPEGGACVIVRLPLGTPPALEEEEDIAAGGRP
jgi:Osmosensitive K+ channel histidine kinase